MTRILRLKTSTKPAWRRDEGAVAEAAAKGFDSRAEAFSVEADSVEAHRQGELVAIGAIGRESASRPVPRVSASRKIASRIHLLDSYRAEGAMSGLSSLKDNEMGACNCAASRRVWRRGLSPPRERGLGMTSVLQCCCAAQAPARLPNTRHAHLMAVANIARTPLISCHATRRASFAKPSPPHRACGSPMMSSPKPSAVSPVFPMPTNNMLEADAMGATCQGHWKPVGV